MAGVRDEDTLSAAGFPLGVNNTGKESELPKGAVREAVNTDFSATGKPSLRDGFVEVYAGTDCHSGWSDDYLPFGLYVDGGVMYAVHADESRFLLLAGLAPGRPVSYARVNDQVLWTNGVQSGQIGMDLTTGPWCAPSPNGQPTLALGSDGSLDAGTYQVAVTFLEPSGRESGAARAVMIDVPANGAIELTNIPQPPAGGRVRIYATGGHDGVLRAAVTLDAGITAYTLVQPPQGQPRARDALLLRPMPPGQLVAIGNGRQFVARGKDVLFSPALRYGLFDPKKGRVGFVERVDMIAFVGDGTDGAGLFVADAKRTYFLPGANPAQWRQVIASAWGALPGQIAFVPGSVWPNLQTEQLLPVWQSRDGRLCVGLPGGQIFHPQPRPEAPDAVFDAASSAALLYRESPGDRRIVSALRGTGPQALAMQDRLVVREYRHDTP